MLIRKTSIVVNVIAALVAVTTLLLGAFGAINYLNVRDRELAYLRAALVLDADQIAPGLALPMWNFDRPQISKIVEAMMKDTILHSMVVRTEGGAILAACERDERWNIKATAMEPASARGLLMEKRSIVFPDQVIGTVTLYATTRFVEARLRASLLWTSFNILALDLVLTLSLYLLLRRWIFEPLQEVEGFAATVSAGGQAGEVREFRGELESLRSSIARMVGQIQARYAEREQATRREQAARKDFTRKLIESQEAERRRIASGLHDSLGQNLLLIKNRATLALGLRQEPAALGEQLTGIADLAGEAISEVRQISHDLRPYQLDQLGLTRALQAMIDSAAQSTPIGFTCKLEPVDELFPGDAATELYRVVQESLNNIMKHSRARQVRIALERDVHHLRLWIEDDGCGFATSERTGQGFGLQNMAERVSMLGGRFTIDSQPGAGTRVEVIIPIREPA